MTMNTHYTRIAQALHWLMAVLLIGLLSACSAVRQLCEAQRQRWRGVQDERAHGRGRHGRARQHAQGV